MAGASPHGPAAGYRRLVGNTAAALMGRMSAVVLALVLSTVLFRILGQERFGLWSLFAYLVGYSTLTDFGLSAGVERRVARLAADGRRGEVVTTIGHALLVVFGAVALVQVLVEGVAFALGAWLGTPLGAASRQGLHALPAALALVTASLVIGGGLSGLQRMPALYAWRTAGMLVGTISVCALAVAGVRRLDALLLGYAAGAPLAAVGQWRVLRRELPRRGGSRSRGGAWQWTVVRELLGFGGMLQVATMGPMLGEYVFRLVVTHRFGVEYAGIYDLATRAALGLRSLAASLFVAMVPFGVGGFATPDRAQVSRLLRLAVKYTALFMLPCSALLVVTSDPIVGWWLGPAAGAAQVAEALRPLVVVHALLSLSVPMAMMGRSAGRPAPEAVAAWGGAAFGVGAAFLAPRFLPAVVVFSAMPLVAGIALWITLARRLQVRFDGWRDLIGAGVVAVAAGIAALAAREAAGSRLASPAVVVAAAAGAWAATGGAVIAALGFIGPGERGVLKSLARITGRRGAR